MTLVQALKRINRHAIKDTLLWILITSTIALIPVLCSYLYSYSNYGSVNYIDPLSHGELALYSISLLGSGVYIISKGFRIEGNYRKISFPGSGPFIALIFGLTAISAIIFSNAQILNPLLPDYNVIVINKVYHSVYIILASLLITLVITLIDSIMTNNPPPAEEIFSISTDQAQRELKRKWR